jgi:drug/metabolite transporter (DMT)-like permease
MLSSHPGRSEKESPGVCRTTPARARCRSEFSFSNSVDSPRVTHGNFYVGFWINVIVGVVGLWGAVLVLEPADAYRASAIPLFMLSGIIGTAGGRLLRFVSIEKVGAPVAASIINLNPFIATGLAILVLGERVTLPIIAGTGVIVLGVFLLTIKG